MIIIVKIIITTIINNETYFKVNTVKKKNIAKKLIKTWNA